MKESIKRNKMNECYSCIHKRNVPGDRHINCAKPDPVMKGNRHGILNGWFLYPLVFDPTWQEKDCANYKTNKL